MTTKHLSALLGMLACGAALASVPQPGLDFDRTFATRVDGHQTYYAATYRTAGQDHRVEVWARSGHAHRAPY